MPRRYCEVALPVPLRSTFTYAVPNSLDGESLVGRRVVVPFRKRAMIGIGLAESEDAPAVATRARASGKSPAAIREIAEVMDPSPGPLPPKLIELGRWISHYYLAPIGEAFRAMLPPEIELRHDREYWLSIAGRAALDKLAASGAVALIEDPEIEMLRLFAETGSEVPSRNRAPLARRGGNRRKTDTPRISFLARGAVPAQDAHAKNRGMESGVS